MIRMRPAVCMIAVCLGFALSGCAGETFFVADQRCSIDPSMSYDFGVPPEPHRKARSLCDPAREEILARRAASGIGVAANGSPPGE